MLLVDCYKLLEIAPDADEKTIRKAWRLKTRDVHPDTNKSVESSDGFLELKSALDTLLDPTKRLQHDRHFGYYEKPKNQDAHAKQQFSDYQKNKAENLVKTWSSDYEKAMSMREEQRQRIIDSHKRRNLIVLIAVGIALAAIGAAVFILFAGH